MLGADYLVLGEILAAEGARRIDTGRLTGLQRPSSHARLALAYRIVVPATNEIKFANQLDLVLEDSGPDAPGHRSAAINQLARRVVGMALDRIYPMQVVAAASPQALVLNQGGNGLAPGDRLTLVELGAPITDPYTREPLGRIEHPIGPIEVIRSDGRLAYARVVGKSSGPARAA